MVRTKQTSRSHQDHASLEEPEQPEPEPEPLCEFTNSCTTNTGSSQSQTNSESRNPRKVISHIFGRNKTATKLFPAHVWVHYCRKHYQRARYRSRDWPFTQCDLLLDSLGRMEEWGGVGCFEVALRRREMERVNDDSNGGREGVRRELRSGSGSATNGRVGSDASADADAGSHAAGQASTRSRSSSSGRTDNDDEDNDYEDKFMNHTRSKSTPKSRGARNKRKRPIVEPAPVPAWLRQEVGPSKSFDDVRRIIHRLRDHLTRLHDEGQLNEIRFPDIEILPNFRKRVLDKAAAATAKARKQPHNANDSRQTHGRQNARGPGRVGRRGGVQKVGIAADSG